ncbi:MAG: transporter [Desulfobacteraceae bacterium]
MKQRRFWVMLLLVLWLVPPATVKGEELEKSTVPTIAARQKECPCTFGPILTDTAVPVEVGGLELQPFWYFSAVIDSFSPSWRRTSAGGDFYSFGFDLQITYGAWENLEVFTVIPVAVNWARSVNEPGPSGDRSASYGGFGDVNLTFKYLFLEEGPVAPAMSAVFATDFPTGHYRHLNPDNLGTDELGGGSYVFTTGLNLAKWIDPFIFYGNFYYSMPTSFTNDDGKQEPRDFVTVNLAAEYPFSEKWIALLELTSFWDGGRLFGPHPNLEPAGLLSILPGIEFIAKENLFLAFGVNVDLIGKNTGATVMPILSLVWAVR